MKSWDQLQTIIAIPNSLQELYRMFPDLNCDFDESDFGNRSMWDCFLEQRRVEMTPDEIR